jgi:hypothetical protein
MLVLRSPPFRTEGRCPQLGPGPILARGDAPANLAEALSLAPTATQEETTGVRAEAPADPMPPFAPPSHFAARFWPLLRTAGGE